MSDLESKNILIDLLIDKSGCAAQKSCLALKERFYSRMVGTYVTEPDGAAAKYVSAAIDLNKYDSVEYFSGIKSIHKGAALRQAKKSDKQGFTVHQFVWSNHIPDIVDINTSKDVRSGGAMRTPYLRSIDEMGGTPMKYRVVTEPACPVHHTFCWGIFEEQEGYMQGNIVTGEKLLGYIKFKRNGNFGLYTSILGHGDYLKFGIMHRLHHEIIAWVYRNSEKDLKGLEYIVYGAIDSGNEGLKQWKRRALFEPCKMVLIAEGQ